MFIEEVVGVFKYCKCKEKVLCKFDMMVVNLVWFIDLIIEFWC